MYATHLNLITQNRELFESRDQSSIDETINILEDLDPDELNFDGIAIEEIMNNEGAVIIEDINKEYKETWLREVDKKSTNLVTAEQK